VPANSADPTQLLDGYVAATLVDHHGRLWVASFGSGVQVLESQDAQGHWRFRRLGLRDGLPHLGVNKLLEDSHGNIWVSTDNGIAVIDGTSFKIRALGRPQGVGMRTFWTNSGAVTADGEILFGANGGLTVVRPDRASPWTYQPPIVVTDARSGKTSLSVAQFNAAHVAASALQISSEQRGLKVEFAALDYSSPERNRYAYRLQGFDADWIFTEANVRLANYTNLPPGNYTLELRGSNRDGQWSAPLRELSSVELVCRRILTSLAEPVTFKDAVMRVTASIGSAQCPNQGSSTDGLYKAADTALYDAKRSGRNMWSWYGQTVKPRASVQATAVAK
jgi:hypothetical protein